MFGLFRKKKPQRPRRRVKAAFGMVVTRDNHVLLIKRGYGREKGKWSLPGGNRDQGETSKRTAIRETREETNIQLSPHCKLYYQTGSGWGEVWIGTPVGRRRIRYQRKECLAAKFHSPRSLRGLLRSNRLAFHPDRKAIQQFLDEIGE